VTEPFREGSLSGKGAFQGREPFREGSLSGKGAFQGRERVREIQVPSPLSGRVRERGSRRSRDH